MRRHTTSVRRRARSPLLLLLLVAVVAAGATIAAAAGPSPDLDAWLGDEDALTNPSPDSDDEVEAAAAALAARASGTPGAPPPPPPRPPQQQKTRASLADAKKRATAAAHKAAASSSPPLMRMRPHEATVWFYVLVGLVMTSLMVGFKESGAGWLLQGLMVLRIKTEAPATATPGGADNPSNKARKRAASNLQQQLQRQQQQQPDIWMEPLRPSLLAQLEFKDALDLVLLYTAVALGVAAAAWLVQRVGGMVPNSLPLITQACVVAYVLAELIKSELAHEAVSKNDRAGYLVAAVVGAASAGAVLVAIPPGRLTDFDADAGGYAAGLQLHETIERRMNGTAAAAGGKWAAPEGGGMRLVEEGLPGVAAWAPCLMAAALISGGLMAPGMRYGRALMQALHPPQWARTFLGGPASSWALAAVRLSFAAPLVVVALWFPPLTDALGLGRGFSETASVLAALDPQGPEHARVTAQLRALALVRGWAVTLAGALQLLAARPLAQAFLNTGLFAWYQLKHVGISNVDDARVAALTRRQVLGALALAAKCGLQMCAPSAVLLPCGALLLSRGAGEGDAFVAVAAGFVAWWTCLTWAFFGALSVLLARLGSQGGVVNVS